MIMQTLAILKDAYRELNAKRLFWVVLILSGVVVSTIAILGNNERGITIFGLTLDFPFLSTKAVSKAGFYKLLFSSIGIQFWLTWAATILALISTAGIFPDFVSSGSIELTLSRPIGRLRLFLTKYAAALLFVILQVAIFSFCGFLVIGLRGGTWEPKLFMAIPIVVVFFSYLFCICVLVGLVTRSAITALLLTILIWLGLWGLNLTDVLLVQAKVDGNRTLERDRGRLVALDTEIAALEKRVKESTAAPPPPAESPSPDARPSPGGAAPPGAPPDTSGDNPPKPAGLLDLAKRVLAQAGPPDEDPAVLAKRLEERRQTAATQHEKFEREERSHKSLVWWSDLIYTVKTFVPKTGETTGLLERYVIDPKDTEGIFKMQEEKTGADSGNRDVSEALRKRSVAWIVGSSLAFELAILTIGAVIFCRRDF